MGRDRRLGRRPDTEATTTQPNTDASHPKSRPIEARPGLKRLMKSAAEFAAAIECGPQRTAVATMGPAPAAWLAERFLRGGPSIAGEPPLHPAALAIAGVRPLDRLATQDHRTRLACFKHRQKRPLGALAAPPRELGRLRATSLTAWAAQPARSAYSVPASKVYAVNRRQRRAAFESDTGRSA
jgi:hypothetical protein